MRMKAIILISSIFIALCVITDGFGLWQESLSGSIYIETADVFVEEKKAREEEERKKKEKEKEDKIKKEEEEKKKKENENVMGIVSPVSNENSNNTMNDENPVFPETSEEPMTTESLEEPMTTESLEEPMTTENPVPTENSVTSEIPEKLDSEIPEKLDEQQDNGTEKGTNQ